MVWEVGNILCSFLTRFRGRKSEKQGCAANVGQEICSHTSPEPSQRDLPEGGAPPWLAQQGENIWLPISGSAPSPGV